MISPYIQNMNVASDLYHWMSLSGWRNTIVSAWISWLALRKHTLPWFQRQDVKVLASGKTLAIDDMDIPKNTLEIWAVGS